MSTSDLPKMFCITLKDTPRRKEYAENHFKQHGVEVEMFEGINNKKFGLTTIIPYMDDYPDWKPGDSLPKYMYITGGHIGCILSHFMLWKTLQYLPYDEFLIFEDDVILDENFLEKLKSYKSQLPDDWQYTFVGHCCLPPESYQIKLSENIITTTHPPMCTHAYMVKKNALQTLIDTNHIAWAHIDIQIQKRSLKQLQHYVFIPPIANQISIQNENDEIFYSLTKKSQ